MINFTVSLSFDKFDIGISSGTIQQRPMAHGPLRDEPSSEDEKASSEVEEPSSVPNAPIVNSWIHNLRNALIKSMNDELNTNPTPLLQGSKFI